MFLPLTLTIKLYVLAVIYVWTGPMHMRRSHQLTNFLCSSHMDPTCKWKFTNSLFLKKNTLNEVMRCHNFLLPPLSCPLYSQLDCYKNHDCPNTTTKCSSNRWIWCGIFYRALSDKLVQPFIDWGISLSLSHCKIFN
jgi:hypothetical protein